MTWWSASSNLTPVGAWDVQSRRVNGFTDRVGVNNLTATSGLSIGASSELVGLGGNSNPMRFDSTITLSGNMVVGVLATFQREIVMLSNDTVGDFALHMDPDRRWYIKQGSFFRYELGGNPIAFGESVFAAAVYTGAGVRLYLNGVLYDPLAPLSQALASITKLGYAGNEDVHNFSSNEFVHGIGVWSGVGTQSDLVAIESALRTATPKVADTFAVLSTPINPIVLTGRGFVAGPPVFGKPLGVSKSVYAPPTGYGVIEGTVKEKGVPNFPVASRVVLVDDMTHQKVDEVVSDAQTGKYVFRDLDTRRTYTVIGYDPRGLYRAVIADRQVPVAG